MSNDAGDSKSGPRAFLNRSATTAPRSNRHSASPETSIRRNTSQTTTRPQPLSYRQLLQQRLQKYQWTATFHVTRTRIGTARNPLWSGSFWMGGTQIGQSSSHTRRDAAKEEAAKAALNWLNTYGYD